MGITTNTSGTFNVPQLRNFVKRCPKCQNGKLYLEHEMGNSLEEVCFACGFRRYANDNVPMPLVDIRELID